MAKHRFIWHGRNRNGESVSGELHAVDKTEVSEVLRQQRIRVTHCHRHFSAPTWLKLTRQPRIHAHDISRFTRQLATLLQAGVPLLQALEILHRGESHRALKTCIHEIHKQVEVGMTLNRALQPHEVFDPLYCHLIAAGEASGMLDVMLDRLAQHLEKTETLRATLRSALVYPCAVLSIAAAVLVLILIFVVPAFQNIFASFGADLPWLTRMVIGLSTSVQHYGFIVLGGVVLGMLWFKRELKHRSNWQYQLHRLLLCLPIAGPLTRHACTARWARTLATLFASGTPLTEGLSSVQGVTGNLLFQSATQLLQSQLMQGKSLSQALADHQNLFPPMVGQMCAIGEESGALDHMLAKTAEHYEREVDHTVMRLSTLLEPFIMVVLGLLIGGLVMALYLPIFQLGQVV